MAGRTKKPDEPPIGVPAYMVSFGDMMTILLTFFILLCSYSTERQAGFVSDGIGSFKNSINAMGLPSIMPADRDPIELGAKRVRYQSPGAVNSELLDDGNGRITDTNRDALRSVVKTTLKTNRVARIPIELVFEPGSMELSDGHKEALDLVASILDGKTTGFRVDAYGFEEGEKKPRQVALGRALALSAYMQRAHGFRPEQIQCVGYGSGGKGVENRNNRVVQDRLGRRIALIYLIPPQE